MNEQVPYTRVPEDLLPASRRLNPVAEGTTPISDRTHLTLVGTIKDLTVGTAATIILTTALIAGENAVEHISQLIHP